MSVFQIFVSGAIVSLLITCIVHSVAGEFYLLRPLFKHRGNRVLENALARFVLRFAWHLTSAIWLLLAAILFTAAFGPQYVQPALFYGAGVLFLTTGLFDLIGSKGKHIGWPLLVAIGGFSLAAAITNSADIGLP